MPHQWAYARLGAAQRVGTVQYLSEHCAFLLLLRNSSAYTKGTTFASYLCAHTKAAGSHGSFCVSTDQYRCFAARPPCRSLWYHTLDTPLLRLPTHFAFAPLWYTDTPEPD
jgi:hypothetical protein